MVPVKTTNTPAERPPYLTYGLIALNIIVFLWETTLPPAALRAAFFNLALVPCELTRNFFTIETVFDLVRSMFMHGDWLHLGGNMLFLWIFGSNIEDYYGRRTFLVMYLFGGAVAALAQSIIAAQLCVPMVGASGAISAVLGSYLILFPGVKVRVGFVLFRFFYQSILLPVWLVLGYWFLLQIINGAFTMGVDTLGEGGVAFFAHIGGFVFGALFAFVYTLFNPAPRVQSG
ncbi:MAG: rhomboid family intramembrane serine protease [Chloroflexota bacterium]|nr:rhomboid family intramembrane serine protease [Chloroflexota bacterium]